MTDWLTVPGFGNPLAEFPVVVRPSAYGLIPDEQGRLALVRTPVGIYLPGGGQADAETLERTVAREAREECGLIVRVGVWRCAAIEQVSAAKEQTHFEKRSTFCDAVVIASAGDAIEADHALMWVSAQEALELLRPESHRWAVTEWLQHGNHSSSKQASRPAV